MIWQVRTYKIRPGHMDDFLALWKNWVVPTREDLGYVVRGGWYDADDDVFVWIVGHEAPDGWEAAEAAYYAHPRRDEFPHQPREFVADVQTRLMREA